MFKKTIIIIISVLFVAMLISPWLSLILPKKFRDHTYNFLVYKIIADRETYGLKDKKSITYALFNYVRNSIFTPAGLSPYEAKPIVYLINATGYCDYNVQVFTALLAGKNIPARYAFLKDKDGISPHTMAEVYIRGKWRLIDPASGLIFIKNNELATIEDVSDNPNLIFMHPKLQAIKVINEEEFNGITEWYSRMFPVPQEPQRSSSKIKRITIFDRITNLYWYIFKNKFIRTYQDLYLKAANQGFKSTAEIKIYTARNYNLTYRIEEAVRIYKQVINEFPNSNYAEDSLFFLSLANINYKKDYKEGLKTINQLLLKFPESRWKRIAVYYLYFCNKKISNIEVANKYYLQSHWELLDIPY
ncbi:MAG: transglutaminase domain-containing protein [Candidatus Omnitrophota bacterium]